MWRYLSLLASAIILGACGSEPEPTATAVPTALPAKPAVPDDGTSKMARAVGNGKPGAAIEVKYEIQSRPEVGKPVELELAFIPGANVEGIEATLSGLDQVTLAGDLSARFGPVTPGQAYKHRFSLLAARRGFSYINVDVNSQIGGGTLSRTYSIPFLVQEPAPQAPAAESASGSPGRATETAAARQSKSTS